MKGVVRRALLPLLSGVACSATAAAQPSSGGVVVPIPPSAPRVDTAPPVTQTPPPAAMHPKHRVELIVPLKERGYYIGDLPIGISPDGAVDVPVDRMIQILQPIASPDLLDALRKQAAGRPRIPLSELSALSLNAKYDPSLLEVSVILPLEDRQRRSLELYALDHTTLGQFVEPASPSAWLTWRTSFDYINKGALKGHEYPGPAFDLTGGARIGNIALESAGRVDSDSTIGRVFQRDYSRLVYDVPSEAVRITLGDLEPGVVGYQASPDMAGVSILKSYSILQPGRNIRPRGLTAFSLRDPGAVEVLINGQLVRRLNLDVGTYDLRDFPFTAGQNNVQLVVEDRSGRRELYSYQQFFDLNLLESGLSEYQFAVGVPTQFQNGEPVYKSKEWIGTGFYHRGLSDYLTLGVNAQGQRRSGMVGLESVWASPLGVVGLQIAGSRINGMDGWAALFNFQHQHNPTSVTGHRWSLGLNTDVRSLWFGTPGSGLNRNSIAVETTGYFTYELGPETSINLDTGYLWKRGTLANAGRARAAIYQRVGTSGSAGLELRWDQTSSRRSEFGVYVTLNWRFSETQYVRGTYDSVNDLERLSWQRTPRTSYGDWSMSLDAERADGNVAVNANVYRQWNRLETSLNHSASYDEKGSEIVDERTSLRLASSIAYADGSLAVGRPIYDAFAIVEPHKSLEGRTVRIDPHEDGSLAETDALGPALVTELSAYSRRTLVIDVEDLPAGYNLDSGTFDLLPPYHGGYRLVVGSDYSTSVIGTLLDRDGKPVALLAGKAYLASNPSEHPIQIFTDRRGRFAATGLKAGLWRVELGELIYELNVQESPSLQRLQTPLQPKGRTP